MMLKEEIKVWREHFEETRACPVCGTVMKLKPGHFDVYACPKDHCETEVRKEFDEAYRVVIRCPNEPAMQEVVPPEDTIRR